MNSSVGVHPSSFILHPSGVLVLRLSALGDVIHTIPAVVSLRATDISWVVEAPYAELVEIVAGVTAIPVRFKQWGRAPVASRTSMAAALRTMRGHEASIDFQGLIKSAMLGALAGAKTRYGFDARAIREKTALLFTNRKVGVDVTTHVIEQNLALARAVNDEPLTRPSATLSPLARGEGLQGLLPAAGGEGARRADEGWRAFANASLDAANRIVILPGAGKPNKLWPAERFRALVKQLGDRALVAWGPGERELAEAIGGRVAPPTNLRELATLLRSADLVIGADTGPLHLAAALGTKVVGLYGPTDVGRNGPFGQLHRCVAAKSMESISVEEVMTMVERVAAE